MASLVAQRVKHLPVMQETQVQSLGQEDPLEKEMATPLQYSCLENPMDQAACGLHTVHRVTKSRTRLSDYTLCHVRQHIHSSLGLSCDISLVVVVGKPG